MATTPPPTNLNPFAPGNLENWGFLYRGLQRGFPGQLLGLPDEPTTSQADLEAQTVLEAFKKKQAEVKAKAEAEAADSVAKDAATAHDIATTYPNTGPYGDIGAVKVGGKGGRIIFTNQQQDYGKAGAEILDPIRSYIEAGNIREANAGTRIFSPYDRDVYGRQTGGATTGSAPGDYVFGGGELVDGKTDWSKVADPMGFSAFREDPIEGILAQRAAEQAKNEALAKDPFAPQRIEAEGRIAAAKAPYEAQRAGTLADYAFLSQLPERLAEELKSDVQYQALKRNNPQAAAKMFQDELKLREAKYEASQARYTKAIY